MTTVAAPASRGLSAGAGNALGFQMNRLVPPAGIEPATFGLQNRCSTAELQGHGAPLAYLRRR